MRRYTVISVVVGLVVLASGINLVFDFSVLSILGFAAILVLGWWVLSRCANEGDPVAKFLLRRA